MARFTLPFLCLVGLTTSVVYAANPTIYVQKFENLYMGTVEEEHQYDITNCDLTLNNGTSISLYKDDRTQDAGSKYYLSSSYEKCRTKIYKINEKDEGTYTIHTTIKTKNSKKPVINLVSYDIKVRDKFEEKKAVPSSSFTVYPDQLISVHFSDNFTNLESCKLLDPKQIEYDLGLDMSVNIKKLGHCGFKMVAQKDYGGEWTLIADLNNNTAYYTKIKVSLRDKKELTPEPITRSFKRGEQAEISLNFNRREPKMCYLIDPYGVEYSMQIGSCSHTFEATDYYKGVWKAYYGFEGMEKLVEQIINVEIQADDVPFTTSVVRSNNGDINLLCQVPGNKMSYCSFVRPDGEILLMTIGVGNNKYEYYGNGSHGQENSLLPYGVVSDCGITIHKPDAKDYGSWRCLVSIGNAKTIGSVMKVAPLSRSQTKSESEVTAKDVYVKNGESYKIKCTADEVLSYCWLRSPNGSIHSVINGGKNNVVHEPSLRYVGTGLELGDCTAMIEKANDTQQAGKWTCHMGIVDGPEIETSLNVIVTDTHLMAERETVLLDSHQETDLICRPLPDSTKAIEACRWVNPLGHGINVDREGRYYTETGTTHCKLSIRMITSTTYEEDVGKWSCYARFANSLEEEVAHMNVIGNNGLGIGSILSIALSVSALATIGIAIFIMVIYKRRLAAMRDFDEKIILEKPAKFP